LRQLRPRVLRRAELRIGYVRSAVHDVPDWIEPRVLQRRRLRRSTERRQQLRRVWSDVYERKRLLPGRCVCALLRELLERPPSMRRVLPQLCRQSIGSEQLWRMRQSVPR
jgi:hypothetical protein